MTGRTKELFEKFVNFPSKYSIVRNGQVNDAFCLVVFETLFKNFHNIKKLGSMLNIVGNRILVYLQ